MAKHAEPITAQLDSTQRDTTCRVLQQALVDLVDLHLAAKQVHWNVVGPQFRTVHLQLDELVASARGFADQVAERSATLGVPADGRPHTVADTSDVPEPDEGWCRDVDAIEYVVSALDRVIRRLRAGIDETDKSDLVTQDLLLGAAAALEKAHWMWQAQLAAR
ncbi:MAG: DNA starvation/stationary phase protection protein [Actinophytocola sp.]|nr:DNA starvation/stationary phase protection protein [Actinophytocola sp.]